MEKLKTIIEKHAKWRVLGDYIERIEAHIETDFSLSLENSKALLETISREICKQKGVELPSLPSMNILLKKAFVAIGYKNDGLVTQVSKSLANIAQQMGSLRNEIGTTSHGKSLEELENRNNNVDQLTRELLIDTTKIVASLLIRSFESESLTSTKNKENIINYSDNVDFNEFWDETYGEFDMGDLSYPASEILYNLDFQAYKNECKVFKTEAKDIIEMFEVIS